MTRAPGFYWIRVKSGGPPLRKEVAEWNDEYWERIGDDYLMLDEAVEVLSERLEEPK